MACYGLSVQKMFSVANEMVVIAVCQTIGEFNTGFSSRIDTMQLCNVPTNQDTIKTFNRFDQNRIKAAAKKVSSKYCKQHQKLRGERKKSQAKLAQDIP